MKKEQSVQEKAISTMQQMRSEYDQLLTEPPISLEALFSPGNFRFDQFCREFSPHPDSEELKQRIQEFGEANGCWLPSAKHHISCALYLYPNADTYRMFCIMKNLTLGFYLNDVMGRDTFHHLPADQQRTAREMILRMARIDESLHVEPGADGLEVVNADMLQAFKDHSPQVWFDKFLEIYSYHIGITHTDGNVISQGRIPGVTEYMDYRCHLGGVHHILQFIEFSDGQFLDWSVLRRYQIAQPLKRLHWVTAAFAGLSNDLFSFEKEVIDNGSDSNLVMIFALNDREASLRTAIDKSAEVVGALLLELLSLLDWLAAETEKLASGALHLSPGDRPSTREQLSSAEPHLARQLSAHREGIIRVVQAVWLWHCYSGRYKRPQSLWVETSGAPAGAPDQRANSAAAFSNRG